MGKADTPLRRFRHFCEPLLARSIAGLAGILPRRICWALAGVIGRVAACVPDRSNDLIELHRKRIMIPAGLEASRSEIYRYISGGVLDFLHLSSKSDDTFRNTVRIEGSDHLEKALRKGKGVIAITAHYSAWELIPRAVRLLGHSTGIVGRALSSSGVSKMLDEFRVKPGVVLIDRSTGGRELLLALQKNTAIGILIDQDTTAVESVFVDFFGIPALTPLGPAKLALRFGIPMLTLHICRMDDGTYLLRIDDMLDLTEFPDSPGAAVEVTQLLTAAIEGWIREDPRQWIWFHERWARRPDGCSSLWEK